MPHWEGIEDAAETATPVWLARTKDTEDWKPLRKCDGQALNTAKVRNETKVPIEFGRATARLDEQTVVYNFFRGKQRMLCSAIWFQKEERSGNVVLKPILQADDSEAIETLYRKVVAASASLGKGIKSLLATEVPLTDGPEGNKRVVTVVIATSRDSCKLVIQTKGWFKGSVDLQRGFGDYTVPGEEEELQLGPIRHVAFVLHGVGEALFSRDEINLPSMVDVMNTTRMALQRKQVADWQEQCKQALKDKKPQPSPPHRIELIPIEWFDEIHNSSTSLMKSLRAVSLQTIPALRMIANDVVFDVLMYLTPEFNTAVLQCVTQQIHYCYDTFMQIHGKEFGENNGRCILIGHSLGSVICWDLLSILKEKIGDTSSSSMSSKSYNKASSSSSTALPPWSSASSGTNTGNSNTKATSKNQHRPWSISCGSCGEIELGFSTANEELPGIAGNGAWGPSLVKPMEKVLPFIPECTLLLGSPIGIFLTLRGAHSLFDQMRYDTQQRLQNERHGEKKSAADMAWLEDNVPLPNVSPFTLPTDQFYNIFHPNDPVAYRIEPLLLSQKLEPSSIPTPAFLTPPGTTVRLSTKAKMITDGIRKTMSDQKSTWTSIIDSTLSVLHQDSNKVLAIEGPTAKPDASLTKPPGGLMTEFPLNNGNRVDYCLQTGVIENEYISAITAHSNYFTNDDFLRFIISLAVTSDTQTSL